MIPTWAVTGPPASGKTTALAALLREYPALERFGVRDFILGLVRRGDPLGLRLREPLARSEVFADGDVRAALALFLDELRPQTEAVVVEGYPRNRRQIADLSEVAGHRGLWVSGLIMVEAPDDVVIQRAGSRRACSACARPAGSDGWRCVRCGAALVRRGDDDEPRLRDRLADYRQVAMVLRDTYRHAGLLHVVDGRLTHAEILRAIREIIAPAREASAACATEAAPRTGGREKASR
jgi:adenylate kinase